MVNTSRSGARGAERSPLMTAAASFRLSDNHFLIGPMESCTEKLPTADPVRAGPAGPPVVSLIIAG